MIQTFYTIGRTLYPIGEMVGKALGLSMFSADEVKQMDVDSAEGDIPNFWTGTIYGISAVHVIVGALIGLALAPMLKPKRRPVRRTTRPRARTYRRKYTRRS